MILINLESIGSKKLENPDPMGCNICTSIDDLRTTNIGITRSMIFYKCDSSRAHRVWKNFTDHPMKYTWINYFLFFSSVIIMKKDNMILNKPLKIVNLWLKISNKFLIVRDLFYRYFLYLYFISYRISGIWTRSIGIT